MKNLIHILNNYHDPFPHIQGRGGLQFHPYRRIMGGMLGGAEETEIIPAETAITPVLAEPFLNDSDDEDDLAVEFDQEVYDKMDEYTDSPPKLSNKDLNFYVKASKDQLSDLHRHDLKLTVETLQMYEGLNKNYQEFLHDPETKLTPVMKEKIKGLKKKAVIAVEQFHKLLQEAKRILKDENPNEKEKNFLENSIKLKYNAIFHLILTINTIIRIQKTKKKGTEEQIDDSAQVRLMDHLNKTMNFKKLDELDEKLNKGEIIDIKKYLVYLTDLKKELQPIYDGTMGASDAAKKVPKAVEFMEEKFRIIDSLFKRNEINKTNKKAGELKRISEQAIIAKAKEEELLRELEQENKGKKSKKKDKKEVVKASQAAEEPETVEVVEAEEPEPEKVSKKKASKKEKAEAVETVADTRTIEQRETDLLNSQLAIATNLDNSIENIFKLSEHKGDALTLNDRDKLLKHYIKLGEMPDAYNILKTIAKLQIKLTPSKNQLELYRKTQATIDSNKTAFDVLDADVLKLMTATPEQPDTLSAGDAYEIVLFKKGQKILKSLTGSKKDFILNSKIPTATKQSDEGIMMDYSSGFDIETLKRAFTYDLLTELACVEAKNYFTMFFLNELKQCGGVVMQISKFVGRAQFVNGREQGYYRPYYILENNNLKLYNVCQSYKSSESGPFEKKWIFSKSKAKDIFFNVKCRDCIVGMNLKDIPFHLEKITDPIGTRVDLLTINIGKSIAKGALLTSKTDDTVMIPISLFKLIT